MKEIWKDIVGFEGYQISNLARIRSCRFTKKYRMLTPWYSNSNLYFNIRLTDNFGKRKSLLLHRLLYLTFVGPIPKGKELDHIDRNTKNNSLDNLRIVTRSLNIVNQKIRQGRKCKGLRYRNNKWEARTSFNMKEVYLGRFISKEEASKAYNDYAQKAFGTHAVLNELM